VTQIPGKSFFQQVTSSSNQPLADFGKKLAVSDKSHQNFLSDYFNPLTPTVAL